MSRIRYVGRRIFVRIVDARAEPPIGAMLAASVVVYALLCLYGFSRL